MTSISDTNVVNAPGGLVELGYSQITSPVNITSTNFASPNNVISDITVVCDGSPIIVEVYSPYLQTSPQTQYSIIPILRYDGSLYKLGIFTADANLYAYSMQFMKVRLTPSAGVHTFGIAASTESGQTAVWGAGTGASGGAHVPSYIRISKIIQASQLIVQTPNAPLVTSLPSNAIDGQEVRYLADNTNGIIWNFRYRAGSGSTYKWEFIGGPPLSQYDSTQYSTTSTSLVRPGSSEITTPLSGDYLLDGSCGFVVAATGASQYAYSHLAIDGTAIGSAKTYVMASAYANSGVGQDSAFTNVRHDNFSAGQKVYMMYACGAAGITVYIRYIRYSMLPIRVSA